MSEGEQKTRVAVIFGGRSGEHAISCATAAGVLDHIDRTRFEPIPIGITKAGAWVLMPDESDSLRLQDGQGAEIEDNGTFVALVPQNQHLFFWDSRTPSAPIKDLGRIDVVMPLLHGPYGEDGTIQGLCEMVGVPYTGCGVGASSNGMDKGCAKVLLEHGGIPVGRYHVITDFDWRHRSDEVPAPILSWGLPVFVKPARAGSSLGVTRVDSWQDFEAAVVAARRHDPKVIVEAAVQGAREIECAVLEGRAGGAPRTTPPGEVVMVSTPGMYDFQSKYFANEAVQLQIPAQIPAGVATQIQSYARQAFQLLGGEGLSRVDFFYVPDTGEIILNEVNTMPGMTPYSLYPGMWENVGLSYTDLVTELIELALAHPQGLR